MLNSSWQKPLRQMLKSLARNDRPARLALMGIGNELNGDDAAGVQVIRRLRQRLAESPQRLLLEAGLAPESFSGPLRRFQPDLVLWIDAAEMGAAPGTVAWLQPDEMDGFSASTHTLPPSVLAGYLTQELACSVGLLGIQVQQVEFDQPLSPAVQHAVEQLADSLAVVLNEA